MSNTLQFSPDACGIGQKVEALADMFEVRAWLAPSAVSLADVADYLMDTSLVGDYETGKFPSQRIDPSTVPGGRDSQEFAEYVAEIVFDTYRERSRILDEQYPFDLAESVIRHDPSSGADGYRLLLAMVVDHSFHTRVWSQHEITSLFEDVVAQVLRTRFARGARMGANRGDFPTALRTFAAALELEASPSVPGFSHPDHANDEGVDAGAHIGWGDDRPGKLVFLGQATLAKQDAWKLKLAGVGRGAWTQWLVTGIVPTRFLAVAQHASSPVLEYLTHQDQNGDLVLDRLRLAPHVVVEGDAARFLSEFVSSATVET